MPVEVDIRNYLAGKATTAGTRVFYDVAPQGTTLPYISITVISTVKPYSHDGAGKKRWRVQLSIYADTHYAAKTLAEAVEGHMEELTNCQKAFFENEIHLQDENVRHIAQDYFVWE